MKKIFLCLVYIFIPFSNCWGDKLTSLRFVCNHWEPYQIACNKKDNIGGFSVEIVRIVVNRLGLKMEKLDCHPLARSLIYLEKGRYDALFSVGKNVENEKKFYYSSILLESPWVMWVLIDSDNDFNSGDDLYGKKIGLISDYRYPDSFWILLDVHRADYEMVLYDVQNFRKLIKGRLDYVVAELFHGNSILRRMGLHMKIVPIIRNPVKIDSLHVIFNKDRVGLDTVVKFSRELDKLRKEPLYKDIKKKFFIF